MYQANTKILAQMRSWSTTEGMIWLVAQGPPLELGNAGGCLEYIESGVFETCCFVI
jgi:hypothetical protein